MDSPQTIYLKELVARYLQAVKDEKEAEARLNKARQDFNTYRGRKATYFGTLQEEGIDPDNLPRELLSVAVSGPTAAPEVSETYALPLEDDSDGQAVAAAIEDFSPSKNGAQPLSETHALFLTFRRAGNPWMNVEEINEKIIEYGYDLPKSEITRVVGRQLPRGMFEKWEDNYRLTAKGMAFNNFRRTPEKRAEGEVTT